MKCESKNLRISSHICAFIDAKNCFPLIRHGFTVPPSPKGEDFAPAAHGASGMPRPTGIEFGHGSATRNLHGGAHELHRQTEALDERIAFAHALDLIPKIIYVLQLFPFLLVQRRKKLLFVALEQSNQLSELRLPVVSCFRRTYLPVPESF